MPAAVLSRRQTLAVLGLPVLAGPFAGSLAGCSSGSSKPSGLERVTYVTGFDAFGREGYAWAAGAKGFYAKAGLQVSIQLGAAGDKNLDLVRAGRAQFACIDYSGAVVRAGRGLFDEFRLVAAVNQRTLIALMALEDGRVHGPKDLAGKTIAVATGSVPETLFPGYARLAGIDTGGDLVGAFLTAWVARVAGGGAGGRDRAVRAGASGD